MEIYLAPPRGDYRNRAGESEIGPIAMLAQRKRKAALAEKRGDQLGKRGLAVDDLASVHAESGRRDDLIGFLICEVGVANV